MGFVHVEALDETDPAKFALDIISGVETCKGMFGQFTEWHRLIGSCLYVQ